MFMMSYWEVTEKLLRSYWEVTEKLLRSYWEVTAKLLRSYCKVTEKLLRSYWEVTEKLLRSFKMFTICSQDVSNKEQDAHKKFVSGSYQSLKKLIRCSWDVHKNFVAWSQKVH